MSLKEFLENICIDEEWSVQYYSSDKADMVVVFDTGRNNSINSVAEKELIKQYGNRRVETIFIGTVRRYYKDYPQIVLEIEE